MARTDSNKALIHSSSEAQVYRFYYYRTESLDVALPLLATMSLRRLYDVVFILILHTCNTISSRYPRRARHNIYYCMYTKSANRPLHILLLFPHSYIFEMTESNATELTRCYPPPQHARITIIC